MSITKDFVAPGALCWLSFNTEIGQSQSGDYAYQKAYAPDRSEKLEDGVISVKVRITSIEAKYGRIQFSLRTVNKDGSDVYDTYIGPNGFDRLTLIK